MVVLSSFEFDLGGWWPLWLYKSELLGLSQEVMVVSTLRMTISVILDGRHRSRAQDGIGKVLALYFCACRIPGQR